MGHHDGCGGEAGGDTSPHPRAAAGAAGRVRGRQFENRVSCLRSSTAARAMTASALTRHVRSRSVGTFRTADPDERGRMVVGRPCRLGGPLRCEAAPHRCRRAGTVPDHTCVLPATGESRPYSVGDTFSSVVTGEIRGASAHAPRTRTKSPRALLPRGDLSFPVSRPGARGGLRDDQTLTRPACTSAGAGGAR